MPPFTDGNFEETNNIRYERRQAVQYWPRERAGSLTAEIVFMVAFQALS